MEKMLKCPNCNSDLKLNIAYTGADWDTVAGSQSGYDYEMYLECLGEACHSIFYLVHAKNLYDVSVVKPELRPFKDTNM